MTGSMNEGAVRIWSFSSNFRKCDHIVLSMNDPSENDSNTSRRQRSMRSKNKLFNISWSNNDVFVLTMQGFQGAFDSQPTKLKVWDAITGLLQKVIHVCEDEANVLALHPLDSSVIATAGTNGTVCVWNLRNDSKLLDFRVLCPPNIPNISPETPIKLLDATFSSDGLRLIVTDHIGRLLVFGLSRVERDGTLFCEQYFSSDYNDFYLDSNGLPIDVGTDLPIHQVPSSYLCRMDGSSYGIDYVVKCTRVALSRDSVGKDLQRRRSWVSARLKTLDISFKLFKRYKSRQGNNSIPSRVIVVENVKATAKLRMPPPVLDDSPVLDRKISYRDYVSDNSDEDEDWVSVGSDEEETKRQRRGRFSQRDFDGSPELRSRRSSRLRTHQGQSEPRRIRSRRTYVIDDEVENTEDSSSDESVQEDRAIKKKKKNVKSRRSQDSAEIANQSLERRQKVPIANNQHSWRCNAKQRRIPIDVCIFRDWALAEEPSDFQYCPQLGDSVIYFPQGHAEYLKSFQETAQPPWISFPAKWSAVECKVTSLQFDFPTQAEHRRSNSIIAIVGLKIIGIPLRKSGVSTNHFMTEFSCLSTRRSSLDNAEFSSFKVVMRKDAYVADFIVPSYLYHRAAAVRWRAGMRIQCPFMEEEEIKLYSGTVIEIAEFDAAYPHSPWECLKVKWDENDNETSEGKILYVIKFLNTRPSVGTLGPWDACLIDDPTNAAILSMIRSQPKFIAPILSDNIKEQLKKMLEDFIEQEVYEPFAYHLDLSIFPDYMCIVPTPMHLDLIRVRNENNYYRSLKAVEFDIQLIYQNCVLYNQLGSEISELAASLVSRLLSSPPFLSVDSTNVNQLMIIESDSEQRNCGDSDGGTPERRKRKIPREDWDGIPKRRRRRVESQNKDLPCQFNSLDQQSISYADANNEVIENRLASSTLSSYSGGEPDSASLQSSHSGSLKSRRPRRISLTIGNIENKSNLAASDANAPIQPSYGLRERKNNLVLSLIKSNERSRRSTRTSVSYADVETSSSENEPIEDTNAEAEAGNSDGEIRRSSRLRVKREADRECRISSEPTFVSGPGQEESTLTEKNVLEKSSDLSPDSARRRSSRLDPSLKHRLYDLMNTMVALDSHGIFKNPITEDIAPGYSALITHPMDFDTMR